MSKEINEIRRLFNERLQEAGAQYLYGVVRKVDAELRTCDVQVEGIIFEGVLLYAVEKADRKGFVALPKVGSTVIVTTGAGGKRLLVVMFSEVDKIIFTAGDKTTFVCDGTTAEYTNDKICMRASNNQIEVAAEQIVFNGGGNKGLVNIEQITDKINEFIDTFNGHTHSIPSGQVVVVGSATTQNNAAPVVIPAPTSKHRKVKRDDYEDTKVTH